MERGQIKHRSHCCVHPRESLEDQNQYFLDHRFALLVFLFEALHLSPGLKEPESFYLYNQVSLNTWKNETIATIDNYIPNHGKQLIWTGQ